MLPNRSSIFEEQCRICENTENIIDVQLDEFSDVLEKLQAVIDSEEQYSNWLRFMCVPCKNKLNDLWNFKIRCKNAYKSYMKGLEEEFNDEEISAKQEDYREFETVLVPEDSFLQAKRPKERNKTIRKSFTCSLCDKTYSRKPFLKAHVEMIHLKIRKRNHLCDICGKSYLYGYQLVDHMKKHFGLREKFSCDICQATLSSRKGLWTHLQLHRNPHKREKRSRTCQHCGVVTEGKAAFYEHLKTHPTIPRHQCRYCAKTFNFLATMKEHLKIHTGDEPYLCKICSKTFKQKSHLNRHMNVHTRARRYSCSYCDKVFTENGTLKVHTRIHTGETPFECSVCSKKFYERKAWKNHSTKCTGK